jgi:uncharacterized protein (TIGR03067 family)
MRTTPIPLLMLLSVLALSHEPTCFADDDSAALQGDWRVVAMQHSGYEDLGASFNGMKWKFEKGVYTLWAGTSTPAGIAGKPPVKGSFSVDANHSPNQFTLNFGDRKILGIYDLNRKKLRICIAKVGNGRPVTFETAGTPNLCYVLEQIERTQAHEE